MKRPPGSSVSSVQHHPSKRFGQNFLIDRNIIQRIVSSLNPTQSETILEIGPGHGALTTELLKQAGRLVAVEFDRHLVPTLRESFASFENFTLIEGDALAVDFCAAIKPAKSARLVANLPYNISTAILQRLFEQRSCLTEMVVMLQREVVERITAPAGSKERGYLSVLVEAYCDAQKLFDVNPSAFRPSPKIWSSVVRLVMRQNPAVSVKDGKLLWAVVSAGFAQKRKTIFNNLRSASQPLQNLIKRHGGASIVLCRAEIELQRRAETLTLEEWGRLVQVLE